MELQEKKNPGAHTEHKRLDLTGQRTFERFSKTAEAKRNEFNGLRNRGGVQKEADLVRSEEEPLPG